jgi:hypothetical protein
MVSFVLPTARMVSVCSIREFVIVDMRWVPISINTSQETDTFNLACDALSSSGRGVRCEGV